ncbi:MAG TPA: hypothetical protein VEX66_08145 [Microlunatus sp.]|nr:hypothetical protein [Microlunatus sp.]
MRSPLQPGCEEVAAHAEDLEERLTEVEAIESESPDSISDALDTPSRT